MEQYLQEAFPRGYIAAFRILGNQEESREACQEAALRALAAKDRYDNSKPFYPWFYRILKNLCLDRVKQKKRIVHTPTEELPLQSPDASAEDQLMQHQQQRALINAIGQLPESLREIIELRHFQDLSYEEIADILACPVGTVMSRLYRARKALREQMKENLNASIGEKERYA